MSIFRFLLVFFFLTFTAVASLPAQPAAARESLSTPPGALSIFESLNGDEALELHLKTNLRQLISHRSAKQYQEASLSYETPQGASVNWNIKIKSRGNARLQVCSLPPLYVQFAKQELRAQGLSGKRKLKLVLSCGSNELYEQLVLREYLVYKLFNVLTEQSFRVQLAYLHLEDSEGKEKTRTTYAFLIEHEDEMADRLDGVVFSPRAYRRSALMESSFDLLSVFQYVIGNTDWFVTNQHNLKLIQLAQPDQVLAVPYDFDYAGIVDAPYAKPHRDLPINSVRQRYFIGACRDADQLDPVFRHILSKKAEMLAVVENCTYLSKQSRNWMLKYLDKSFEILADTPAAAEEMAKGCGWKI